jgi:hypothetical protein
MRRRSKPHTFEGRIEEEKARLEEQIKFLPNGSRKDELLRKIRQLNTASHLSEWLRSPGLRPPE